MTFKKTIHVHQQKIRQNLPSIIVRTYKKSTHHKTVRIDGPATLTQYDQPDSCGARVVLTTYSDVYADDRLIE